MNQQAKLSLEPRMEEGKALVIAGVGGRYGKATMGDIPRLWELFDSCIKGIRKRVGGMSYGVCYNSRHDEFDYIAGVEVPAKSDVPSNFQSIEIPAHRYAVFPHYGPVQALKQTYERVIYEWLPSSGYKVVGPDFERYSADFNADKGTGTVEIWLPVEAKA
ncbi:MULTISPECIES: GyrI-like domain-containing protein [unclassified Pseudomonas]|uniref:GyrI-like domain-containing protein n=1 Tax=unclassified Pseudomonas TaxID=196821 RepID=UPI0011EBB9E4|nr:MULTISPECIES: GyrI-like domain-containing protein [unclassified Pseudomonas]KAA0943888.1 AraC family transcriptional regulator [Pseudomonas sp. ANT_H4]KAA0950978.1 AraC family transcriptional regulator [Pseudomonas sp. ANT_H14]